MLVGKIFNFDIRHLQAYVLSLQFNYSDTTIAMEMNNKYYNFIFALSYQDKLICFIEYLCSKVEHEYIYELVCMYV
ncbi:hypothetical protein T4D_1425 [Trichinella pseudospiralis]|uniref:Uncharacterized protein n=1 Tax=Trichinella pseudospiralis TaxID=6337 RepID=A0A0V1F8L8_TRIPS|nr:hypothetical protein T4D_1425 [Trichinella pseudospiralis]